MIKTSLIKEVIKLNKAMKSVLYFLPILLLMVLIGFSGEHSAAAHSLYSGGHFHREVFGPVHASQYIIVQQATPFMGLGWLVSICKILLITVGGLMLGLIKNKNLKLAGAILLSLGILWLLPDILAIPIIIVIFYLTYKKLKSETSIAEEFTLEEIAADRYYSSLNYSKDYLDEWEKTIRKED